MIDLPANTDLELAILGAVLADRKATEQHHVDHRITEDHFTRDVHRVIWRIATGRLNTKGGWIDRTVLEDTLQTQPDINPGNLPADHIIDVVAQALDHPDGQAGANPDHATRLRDIAERRRMITVANHAIRDWNRPQNDPRHTAAQLEAALADGQLDDDDPLAVISAAREIENAIPEWENPSGSQGLSTGFNELDQVPVRLQDGRVMVIAAQTSVGKTTLAMDIGAHVASRLEKNVLMISAEMIGRELAERVAASRTGIPNQWFAAPKAGNARDDERWERVMALPDDPAMNRVAWTTKSSVSVPEIAQAARRHHARVPGGIGLLIVDYLQLLRADDNTQNRTHVIGHMSREIKRLATDLSIPIILVAQLNRDPDKREDAKPKIGDLRDSGEIEQNADQILLIWRKDRADKADDASPGVATIIVGKNRNGPRDTMVDVVFQGEFPRFVAAPPGHLRDAPKPAHKASGPTPRSGGINHDLPLPNAS